MNVMKITNLSEDEIEENKKYILAFLGSVDRPGIDKLIEYLNSTNFFSDPASAYYHGAFKGGLALHSIEVFKTLRKYKWSRLFEADDDEIVISALMHDICKANTYSLTLKNVKENGEWIQVQSYKNERPEFPYGHGEKSVDILRDFIPLTLNEKLAIRYHMGPYEGKESWNDLGYAQEISPLAFWLHVADAFVSRYIC